MNYQDNDGNPRIPLFEFFDLNYGPANYDRTHSLSAYWVWNLPFGTSERWATSGVTSKILGGWQINGVLTSQSGTPITIAQNTAGNLNALGSAQYPDQVASTVRILEGVGPGNPYFDTTAFAPVNIPAGQAQRFGNTPRNPIRGPGFFNVDAGVFRTIPFGSTQLQLRLEVLNLTNHVNFANPGGDISNAGTFGIISSTLGGGGERQARFGVRFAF
jgi:hypothetical protein